MYIFDFQISDFNQNYILRRSSKAAKCLRESGTKKKKNNNNLCTGKKKYIIIYLAAGGELLKIYYTALVQCKIK